MIVYGDQLFNQYQEKEQSPLTWTQEKPRHVTLEIQDLVWDRHNIVASLNLLMGFLYGLPTFQKCGQDTYQTQI
jgi:hypothetical protein